MRYNPLSASTYREHRARFRQHMEKAGLVSSMQSNGNREILAPNRSET